MPFKISSSALFCPSNGPKTLIFSIFFNVRLERQNYKQLANYWTDWVLVPTTVRVSRSTFRHGYTQTDSWGIAVLAGEKLFVSCCLLSLDMQCYIFTITIYWFKDHRWIYNVKYALLLFSFTNTQCMFERNSQTFLASQLCGSFTLFP